MACAMRSLQCVSVPRLTFPPGRRPAASTPPAPARTVSSITPHRSNASRSSVRASSSAKGSGRARLSAPSDKDLHAVLGLASLEELEELYSLLHARSVLSPVLKSWKVEEWREYEPRTREELVAAIEGRFRFLAADSQDVLAGRLPSYRQTLLLIRRRLEVPCSRNLATEDLESEIFLHLLKRHSAAVDVGSSTVSAAAAQSLGADGMAAAAGQSAASRSRGMRLVERLLAPLTLGGKEVAPALANVSSLALAAAARSQLVRGSHAAVARAALHHAAGHGASRVAQQGLAAAAGRYAAARGVLGFLGPLVAVTTALELSLLSIGTDYGRVVQAVFAIAQIRLLRTWGWQEGEGGAPSPSQTQQ